MVAEVRLMIHECCPAECYPAKLAVFADFIGEYD